MIATNVQCYKPACGNQAIRQCPGYKSNCGRFYCASHSEGTLCGVCAARKDEYDILQNILRDYAATAEAIPQHPVLAAGLEAVVVWVALILVGGMLASAAIVTPGGTTGTFVGVAISLLATPAALVLWSVRARKRGQAIRSMVARVQQSKPHFEEFYSMWLAQNMSSPDEIVGGLVSSGTALGVGLAGVALAAYTVQRHESLYDDVAAIRRAVDG